MFVQPFREEKVILQYCNIASIPYSLDNTLLKIYFWYFYDSALHNVCIIKYDVHIERCTALLGIIHCGAAWPLVSLLLQAAGTAGTRTNETKLICIGTIYQWAFKSASSSSPAAVERINQRHFSQICLILSFGPSEENSIQLEGKDICNGWLSRSGTYSNICNIPILPIILIWFLWPFQMYISFKVFITAPDSGRKLVQFSISNVEVLYNMSMK